MMIARSLHYYILGAARYLPQVQDIIYGIMVIIPKGRELFPTFIWAIMFLIFFFILNSTKLGRHIYAVGGDVRTATITGVSVSKIKFSAFIFSTIFVITASFVYIYRVAFIAPNAGELYLLDSIAAPIIGGIYLFGGRGKLWKVIVGAFFLEILINFMHLIGVNPLIFPAVKGALIAIGVFIALAFTPSYLKTKLAS